MRKHNRLLVLILFLVLALYGCTRGQSQPSGAPTDAFIGGTDGIVFEFEKDAPPPEVTDGAAFPFKVILRFENKGEFKISNTQSAGAGEEAGKLSVKLVGFNPLDFNQPLTSTGAQGQIPTGPKPMTDTDITSISGGLFPTLDLEPRKRTPEGEVIDGGISFVTFPPSGGSFNAVQFPGNTEFNFKAEVCYKYQTRAVTKLCILKTLIDQKPNVLCNPNEGKPTYNSGSPVQVANFRQNVVGQDEIVFSFDIVHSGSGTIYKDRGADAQAGECPRDDPTKRRASLDKLYLQITTNLVRGGVVDVTRQCGVETDGAVRLIDGSRTVTCRLNLQGQHQTDFESLVNIKLDFNYDDSKTIKVLVKHLPR